MYESFFDELEKIAAAVEGKADNWKKGLAIGGAALGTVALGLGGRRLLRGAALRRGAQQKSKLLSSTIREPGSRHKAFDAAAENYFGASSAGAKQHLDSFIRAGDSAFKGEPGWVAIKAKHIKRHGQAA